MADFSYLNEPRSDRLLRCVCVYLCPCIVPLFVLFCLHVAAERHRIRHRSAPTSSQYETRHHLDIHYIILYFYFYFIYTLLFTLDFSILNTVNSIYLDISSRVSSTQAPIQSRTYSQHLVSVNWLLSYLYFLHSRHLGFQRSFRGISGPRLP